MSRSRIVATTQIACSGENHTLLVDANGKLILPDHDVDLERSLAALGAELPACIVMLDHWKAERYQELTLPLRQAVFRVNKRYIDKLRTAIDLADYRKPSTRWVDRAGVEVTISLASWRPSIDGESQKVWDTKRSYSGTFLDIKVRLVLSRYRYMLKTFKNGLIRDAKGKDWVVLSMRKEKKGSPNLFVRAGRQGRGLSIFTAQALAVPDKDAPNGYILKKWL
jgi:hypothetical protein